MDSIDKFWAIVWALLTVGVVGLTISYIICNEKDNQTMLDMVKAGASPLEAHCAVIGSGNSNDFDCNILMSGK